MAPLGVREQRLGRERMPLELGRDALEVGRKALELERETPEAELDALEGERSRLAGERETGKVVRSTPHPSPLPQGERLDEKASLPAQSYDGCKGVTGSGPRKETGHGRC